MESTLLFAAENGDIASLRRALKSGKPDINVNARGKHNQTSGYSALMLSSKFNKLDCVKLLIEEGASTEIRNKNGFTALMLAAANNNLACMEVLLSAGANIEAKDNYGITSLMYAATGNRIEALKLLLDWGALTESIHDGGSTALMKASEKGNIGAVDVLLSRGADIDAKDFQGNSAIMLAARQMKKECFQYLIRQGADVSLTNKKMLPVASTFLKENPDIQEIITKIWNNSPLHISIYLDDKLYLFSQNVKGHIVRNIDFYGTPSEYVVGKGGDAWTPLHVAAYMGRVQYANFLLQKGANFSLITTKSRCTALHLAASRGHVVIVTMLLTAMMKSNELDCKLETSNDAESYAGDGVTRRKIIWEENFNDLSLDSLEIDRCIDSP